MLMIVGAVLILAAAGLWGDLRRLATIELIAPWLLPAALLLQVLALAVFADAKGAPAQLLHIASYAVVGVFVYLNRHLPGVLVMAAGAASNGITITLNGGTLPGSAAARERAGIPIPVGDSAFANSGVVDDPKLAFLGDIFAVPSYVPFANVYSIGDALLFIGMALLIGTVCRVPGDAAASEEPVDAAVERPRQHAVPLPRQAAAGRRRKAGSRRVTR